MHTQEAHAPHAPHHARTMRDEVLVHRKHGDGACVVVQGVAAGLPLQHIHRRGAQGLPHVRTVQPLQGDPAASSCTQVCVQRAVGSMTQCVWVCRASVPATPGRSCVFVVCVPEAEQVAVGQWHAWVDGAVRRKLRLSGSSAWLCLRGQRARVFMWVHLPQSYPPTALPTPLTCGPRTAPRAPQGHASCAPAPPGRPAHLPGATACARPGRAGRAAPAWGCCCWGLTWTG